MENMNSMPLFMPKKPKIYMLLFNLKRPLFKTIFINNHGMCSMISSYCCNHLNSMLMSVKLIMIQLELNDIGYKLVFHSYSKSTSNTWYTLIWKFEKCKQKKKEKGMNIYHLLDFFFKKKFWKNWEKMERKEMEKQTSSFGILKTIKKWKMGELKKRQTQEKNLKKL